jgi:hypothetical protein
MPYVEHRMTSLIKLEPKRAADEMADAYRATGANAKAAAEKLGTREETWCRWVKRLDAALGMDRMSKRLATIKAQARREGWHHTENTHGGRPPGSKNRKRRAAA